MLIGYRTYIVTILMLVKAGIDLALGDGLDVNLILQALAIAGLRSGIARVTG